MSNLKGYKIENKVMYSGSNFILVFNWHGIKEVMQYSVDVIPKEDNFNTDYLVAIFKNFKLKENENTDTP